MTAKSLLLLQQLSARTMKKQNQLPKIASTFLLIIYSVVSSQEIPQITSEYSHYDIKASINPENGDLKAKINMSLKVDASTDTLRFLIHENLLLVSITSSSPEGNPVKFNVKPFMENIKEIAIAEKDIHYIDKRHHLNWLYEGRLQNEKLTMGHATISPVWTELPLEAMWVPSLFPFKNQTFIAEIELPEDYTLVSPGNVYFKNGRWKIKSSLPLPDVVIIASNQMKTKVSRITDNKTINVHYVNAEEATVDFILNESKAIFEHYKDFLPLEYVENEIFVTISPITDIIVQNYARNNLIAIGKDYLPGRDLYQLLAHESAHFWWSNAADINTIDNFLNESFAQFFAMYMVGKKYGNKELEDMLARTREAVKELPPLDKLKQSDMRTFTYGKGPVLLFDLWKKMGDQDFKRFLKTLIEKRIQTFNQFLIELKGIAKPSIYNWFISELD